MILGLKQAPGPSPEARRALTPGDMNPLARSDPWTRPEVASVVRMGPAIWSAMRANRRGLGQSRRRYLRVALTQPTPRNSATIEPPAIQRRSGKTLSPETGMSSSSKAISL